MSHTMPYVCYTPLLSPTESCIVYIAVLAVNMVNHLKGPWAYFFSHSELTYWNSKDWIFVPGSQQQCCDDLCELFVSEVVACVFRDGPSNAEGAWVPFGSVKVVQLSVQETGFLWAGNFVGSTSPREWFSVLVSWPNCWIYPVIWFFAPLDVTGENVQRHSSWEKTPWKCLVPSCNCFSACPSDSQTQCLVWVLDTDNLWRGTRCICQRHGKQRLLLNDVQF